jgi:hypothetical protein
MPPPDHTKDEMQSMESTETKAPAVEYETPDLAASHRSLSESLRRVLEGANGESITVQTLMDLLRERGVGMVLVILTLPFLVPVPTMGLSAPAGAGIAIFGLCVMLNLKPWLPGFVRRRSLSYAALKRITTMGDKLEKWLKPRLKFMTWPGINAVLGFSLILCGVFMALPLPIPFTNSVPAFAIILLLLGLIERDGIFVLLGEIMTLTSLGLFIWLGWQVAIHGTAWLKSWGG